MMKLPQLLFFLSIFYLETLQGQNYDFSGTWNGSVRDADSAASKPFTLVFSLIDTCTRTYRVHQYETRSDENGISTGHVSYNMLQFGNTLLRDAMSHWKNYQSNYYSVAAHLKLSLSDSIRLIGKRSDHYENDEKIILKKAGVVNPSIGTCDKSPTTNTHCSSMLTVTTADTFEIIEPSLVNIRIADDGVADSDRVTIFIGDKILLNNVPIYKDAPYVIPLAVLDDVFITWCACNQGKYGLNTGAISVEMVLGENKKIPIHLKTNERTTVYIRVRKSQPETQVK